MGLKAYKQGVSKPGKAYLANWQMEKVWKLLIIM